MDIRPLTPDLLDTDFRALTCFHEGACWCGINQFREVTPAIWDVISAGEGAESRARIEAALARGESLGYLGYIEGKPVAWCGAGALLSFPLFHKRAEVLGEASKEVAAIVCFSIHPDWRKQGISRTLLPKVIDALWEQGYAHIEAYPHMESVLQGPDGHDRAWLGYPQLYRDAGFQAMADLCPHAKPGDDRPVYRLTR